MYDRYCSSVLFGGHLLPTPFLGNLWFQNLTGGALPDISPNTLPGKHEVNVNKLSKPLCA